MERRKVEVTSHSLNKEVGLVGGETKESERERLVLNARGKDNSLVLEILLNLCELVLGTGTNNGCAHIIVCFN